MMKLVSRLAEGQLAIQLVLRAMRPPQIRSQDLLLKPGLNNLFDSNNYIKHSLCFVKP